MRRIYLFNPVEGTRNRLFPHSKKMLPSPFVHLRIPAFIDSPIRGEDVNVFKKTDPQSSSVGSAKCRGLLYCRTHDECVQNVGLELHEKIVGYHSTVHSHEIESNIGVFLHRFGDLADLVGSSL